MGVEITRKAGVRQSSLASKVLMLETGTCWATSPATLSMKLTKWRNSIVEIDKLVPQLRLRLLNQRKHLSLLTRVQHRLRLLGLTMFRRLKTLAVAPSSRITRVASQVPT